MSLLSSDCWSSICTEAHGVWCGTRIERKSATNRWEEGWLLETEKGTSESRIVLIPNSWTTGQYEPLLGCRNEFQLFY